ncbi:MAG: type 1 glutamine amidotransferase [Verrucomicrobia bacterium]|nr:type 1 glutamine amidotransferase [Verrucomicrobiota bacterium]
MRIVCLQHVSFEGPAGIGAWAAARGFPVSVVRLFANEPLPGRDAFDLLVILGGPMSVHDEERFDWLRPEQRFIRHAIENGKGVLGICLGAQLIAQAMGAQVWVNEHREIGWFPVRQTPEAGTHPVFSVLPAAFTAFHWHGETFDLPAGATRLAQSDGCAHQAFAIGPRVLGLQFHLESTPESVEALIQNCPGDLAPGRFVQEACAMRTAHPQFQEANRLLASVLDRLG